MKQISEFILEQLVTEEFASSIVQTWKEQCSKFYGWKFLMREYQWDKITDNDLIWYDQAEAKKLAYKRNETWTLFWVDSNDVLLGYSTGNYTWSAFDLQLKKIKSIMPMVRASKGAYAIDDKFSTTTLRAAREEAKRNATALMDNEKIKDENIKRYEKIIKDNKIKDGSLFASLRARFDDLINRYKGVFDEVGNAADEDFPQKLKFLANISDSFKNAIIALEKATDQYELEKNGSMWGDVKSEIESCDKYIEKFNAAFSD